MKRLSQRLEIESALMTCDEYKYEIVLPFSVNVLANVRLPCPPDLAGAILTTRLRSQSRLEQGTSANTSPERFPRHLLMSRLESLSVLTT